MYVKVALAAVVAAMMLAFVPIASAATVDQIIQDAKDGQIDGAYSKSDLNAALSSPLLKTYGGKNGVEAVKSALGTPDRGHQRLRRPAVHRRRDDHVRPDRLHAPRRGLRASPRRPPRVDRRPLRFLRRRRPVALTPVGGTPERPNGAVLKTPIAGRQRLPVMAAQGRRRRRRAKLP